jgi:outer membrane protein assembly factor BamB
MKRFLASLVLLVGCTSPKAGVPTVTVPSASSTAIAPVATVAASAVASPSATAPLVINDRLIDPASAATIGRVVGATQYDTAVPLRDGGDRYAVGDRVVDSRSGATVAHKIDVRFDGSAVVRHEPSGAVRWTAPLAGVHSVRPPDAIAAGGVAVVAVDSRLQAFDDATGKPRWSARGPADRLATNGTFAFVTDCTSGKVPGRALVAIRLLDGTQAWRAPVADEMDPDAIEVLSRYIVVRDHKVTVVLDHGGRELYRLLEGVQSVHPVTGGLLVFSDKRVALLDDAGAATWTRPPMRDSSAAGNDVLDLGGDLLIGNFNRFSDSGVELIRFNGATGALKWQTKIPGLNVAHSEYLHVAYLEVRSPKVLVVSQGSGGSFFESVDLATGKRERRCDPAVGRCVTP